MVEPARTWLIWEGLQFARYGPYYGPTEAVKPSRLFRPLS